MFYRVRAKIIMEHTVEAGSKKEAETKANEIGESNADWIWYRKADGTYWTAKRISLAES